MKKKVFLIALIAIFLLLLFFCNQRLNENTETTAADTLTPRTTETKATGNTSRPLTMLIVPGEKIGGIALGQTAESLRILGTPSKQDAAMGKAWMTWTGPDARELNIFTTYRDDTMKEKVVKLIRTTSPEFRTESGAGPGQAADSVRKAFPSLEKAAAYTTADNHHITLWANKTAGIAFETDFTNGQNTCVGVIVFEKGTDVTAFYRTFRPDLE